MLIKSMCIIYIGVHSYEQLLVDALFGTMQEAQ
jgi:hypothetical protein